jgi:protein TonB
MLACTAAALLIVIACVHLWPLPDTEPDNQTPYRISEQEVIDIEEIQPTAQNRQAPPPPAPPIPILLPDNTLLDDHEIDLSDAPPLDVEDTGDDIAVADGPVETQSQASGQTIGPKAVRFVEPEYTRDARRKRVRAEVVVKVLVGDGGRVLETRIEERFLLDRDGTDKTPVAEVGYGLEEAALSAAKRWIFRPARENGKPVSAYTTLTFTFGV